MRDAIPGIKRRVDREAPKGTQAVIRAIRLLKTVSRAREEVTLVDLCSELGLSKPTVHRILSALMSEGLVVQNPASRWYRIGPAAVALGAHSAYRTDLRKVARLFLESLAAKAGETTTLEVPIGNEMLILDEVEGRHIIGARTEVGTRWPMHATSTGKSVLAGLPPDELESRLKEPKERLTTKTITGANDLRTALKGIRKKGYATAVGELQPDFSAVGAAVRDSTGAVVASLSIGGPSERLPRKRLRELGILVREAADELSRSLSSR